MYTKHEKGFTLLEILAVLAIMGILAALAVPRFLISTTAAEGEVCNANQGTLALQVERYYLANDAYPADFDTLAAITDYFPQGPPVCPGGGVYSIAVATGAVACTLH